MSVFSEKPQQKISNDLYYYTSKANIRVSDKELVEMLEKETGEEAEYPDDLKLSAWILLQHKRNSTMRYHNSTDLGEFVYDSAYYDVWFDHIWRIKQTQPTMESWGHLPEGCVRSTIYNNGDAFTLKLWSNVQEVFIFSEDIPNDTVFNFYAWTTDCSDMLRNLPSGFPDLYQLIVDDGKHNILISSVLNCMHLITDNKRVSWHAALSMYLVNRQIENPSYELDGKPVCKLVFSKQNAF